MNWKARAQVLGAILVITAWPAGASATLGGSVSSVEADRVQMQGALLRIVRSDTYTLNEIRSASGTTVREFVSSTGTVFGVAWEGPWLPDMQQVLGTYFEPYRQAAEAVRRSRKGRAPLHIQQSDLVVEVSGHARAFTGRAYVGHLMPQGVQVDVIR